MTDMAFYGTLRHLPLLEIVLGRSAADLSPVQATLPDHAVFWADGQSFPTLVPERGGRAELVLVRGLSAQDVARLDYYEGGFDYALRPVAVDTDAGPARASIYFASDGRWEPGAPWSLNAWVSRWGALTERAATEAMAHYGQWSAQDLDHRFPSIRRRAASWLAAQARSGGVSPDAAIDTRTRAFTRFFALDTLALRHRRYDGRMTARIDREAFLASDASIVLPYDPVRDEVLLIEQFRAPVLAAGDNQPWMVEAVAGLVDPGETPQEAAHRECIEEAGLTPRDLVDIGGAYSSPGNSTEYLHLFIAVADFTQRGEGGGLDSEGEDIRVIVLSFADFRDALLSGAYRNMPLLTTGLRLLQHRDRLRMAG